MVQDSVFANDLELLIIGVIYTILSAVVFPVYVLIIHIALVIGSIYIFLVWAIGCITQNFLLTGPNWSYDMTVNFAGLFADLELVLCFPTLILSFSSYILIVYKSWFEMTNVTLASLNCAWILFSHLNSILLIATNKSVRDQIFKPFCNRISSRSRPGPLMHVSSVTIKQ
ncbi:hypothetical protein CAEBREN_31643 [Caenorhabditis brenneri]|uniref:Uncharacterized protein n=1 Tax=Caenorhabditis brenneri TaxID=135651 RepID=G0NEL8_CAEBE|nr:hypothetical protein CAEBREN_31643 [Caenorhabditis brenneri]